MSENTSEVDERSTEIVSKLYTTWLVYGNAENTTSHILASWGWVNNLLDWDDVKAVLDLADIPLP